MSFPRVEGYVVVEKLGAGSHSTVYKAYTKTGGRAAVAIKCVEKARLRHPEAADNLLTEIRLLKTLHHPHVVHMKEFCWDSKYIFIVMEYCGCGDLSRFIRRCGRLPERRVLYFLQQLASALQFLWEKGIAHMDLKPHNLLLSKGSDGKYTLKVADFGFARYMSPAGGECGARGSPLYMAPEMLSADSAAYDASVDLWSVGVIMYECLFGKAPYSSGTFKELMEKIVNKHPIQAVALIKSAMETDSRRQYADAFRLYCESLRYLVPVVNAETDSVRRSALRAKVTRYMQRAEELKQFSRTASLAPPPLDALPALPTPPPQPPAARRGALAGCLGAASSGHYGERAAGAEPQPQPSGGAAEAAAGGTPRLEASDDGAGSAVPACSRDGDLTEAEAEEAAAAPAGRPRKMMFGEAQDRCGVQ